MDVRFMRNLRLGGTADNFAMLASTIGALTQHPAAIHLTSQVDIPRVAMGMAGAGLAALTGNWLIARTRKAAFRQLIPSEVQIASDRPPYGFPGAGSWNGYLLGFCVDTGKPVVVPWEVLMKHISTIGASGFGKTVLGEWMIFQQIIAGGGLLWIDGKLDSDNLAMLDAMCAWAGRRGDLLVINPGDPSFSNTYNPVLYGDADEVSSRVISLIPSSEGSPATDYYRQAANQGITTLVDAIQKAGLAYNFIDLTILLQNQHALSWLGGIIPTSSDAGRQFRIFLEQYKTVDRSGQISVDLKKLRDTFGGVGGRMHQFGSGNFGMLTNTYSPEVRLDRATTQNKIVYLALPTMGKPEAASNFGKMTLGDFRTSISWVQAKPKADRPWPPTLGLFDEAGSYVNQTWARPFEQARSAHTIMAPIVQTKANYDAVDEELREMITGNANTKIYFKLGTSDTAEFAAELIGMESKVIHSLSESGGGGEQRKPGDSAPTSASQTSTRGYSEREDEGYKVSMDMLKALDTGECVVTIGNSRCFHVRVPKLDFTDEFRRRIGPFQINRYRMPYVRGLDIFRDVDRWISK